MEKPRNGRGGEREEVGLGGYWRESGDLVLLIRGFGDTRIVGERVGQECTGPRRWSDVRVCARPSMVVSAIREMCDSVRERERRISSYC